MNEGNSEWVDTLGYPEISTSFLSKACPHPSDPWLVTCCPLKLGGAAEWGLGCIQAGYPGCSHTTLTLTCVSGCTLIPAAPAMHLLQSPATPHL